MYLVTFIISISLFIMGYGCALQDPLCIMMKRKKRRKEKKRKEKKSKGKERKGKERRKGKKYWTKKIGTE
jgi:hypothetical protein